MLLDLRGRGRWFALSPSGALWWRHLASGMTADAAADRVAEHYGVPAHQVRADMRALAEELVRRRLLTASRPGKAKVRRA
ncbi:PqqD family protein [Streptomyces sp. NPDC059003]|uniref:PqqD family protein n=1 Tax=Streptomyces sp. NPDC059003 TaxID=3346691 RepID=UPI0036B84881